MVFKCYVKVIHWDSDKVREYYLRVRILKYNGWLSDLYTVYGELFHCNENSVPLRGCWNNSQIGMYTTCIPQ